MYYSAEQFRSIDEAQAIADGLRDLAPMLYETLNAARSDVVDRYPSDLFWDNQNRVNIPRMVNQRCARIWTGAQWMLEDQSGYLHLREQDSGLRAILRRVDPITHGLPKSNATKASRAYYLQSSCRPAGALKPARNTLFTPQDAVAPDLNDSRLILAWQEIEGRLSVTAYRPLEPARYGQANKYDFSLLLADEPGVMVTDFTPIDDNTNLLPSLIADDVDEELLYGIEE